MGLAFLAGSCRRAHDIFQQQSIIKEFGRVMYLGKVTGLESDHFFQHVQYVDGDSEDLEDHEILQQLASGPFSAMAFTSTTGQKTHLQPGDFVTVSFAEGGERPCRIEELWMWVADRESYAVVREASCSKAIGMQIYTARIIGSLE
ncbi:hypothetical protein WJX74_010110 [Apatococcus lobatus]|uniref:PTM/DIR17-like Tudor domain-containing protein n=1 Tax=Apatococcus lobatus TaxID=904363 RepID=A0AAW1SCQ9_9CHLO